MYFLSQSDTGHCAFSIIDFMIAIFSTFRNSFAKFFKEKGRGELKKEKRWRVGGGLFLKIEKHKNVLAMYYNTQTKFQCILFYFRRNVLLNINIVIVAAFPKYLFISIYMKTILNKSEYYSINEF